jgi:hypothetical protein
VGRWGVTGKGGTKREKETEKQHYLLGYPQNCEIWYYTFPPICSFTYMQEKKERKKKKKRKEKKKNPSYIKNERICGTSTIILCLSEAS